VVIFAFDLTSGSSFQDMEELLESFKKECLKSRSVADVAVVGTKTDLVFEHEIDENQQIVQLRERMGVRKGPLQVVTNRAVS